MKTSEISVARFHASHWSVKRVEEGQPVPIGGMYDFGPGKRGLSFPFASQRNEFAEKEDAVAAKDHMIDYARDVIALGDKREGSSRLWEDDL